MPEKSHASAVVLCPPGDARGPIQRIRERHDRNFRRWMPHVTLLYPFVPAAKYTGSVIDRLGEAVRMVEPFDLTLSSFEYFRHRNDSHTLWLDPQPGAKVDRLQEALSLAFPDYDDVRGFKTGFTPHLSVGQAASRADCLEVLRTLQEAWTPISFKVDQISLIWRNDPPDDVFRLYRTVLLGSGKVVEPEVE